MSALASLYLHETLTYLAWWRSDKDVGKGCVFDFRSGRYQAIKRLLLAWWVTVWGKVNRLSITNHHSLGWINAFFFFLLYVWFLFIFSYTGMYILLTLTYFSSVFFLPSFFLYLCVFLLYLFIWAKHIELNLIACCLIDNLSLVGVQW